MAVGPDDRGDGLAATAMNDTESAADAQAGPSNGMDATAVEAPLRESKRMLHGWKRGDTIGRFVVLAGLGAGGMGVVLSAYDPQLDRKVAIKIVRPELAGGDATSAIRSRLLREAQAMAKLTHPNVIIVYDVGAIENDVFVAMELVDGGTLAEWLRREPRRWREVLAMLVKAGRGLAAAHHAGLVHRDFKPDNVLVGTDGRVRVTDFGLVGTTDSGDALTETLPAGAQASSPHLEPLTRTGAIMGTPSYMAPEQFDGKNIDARADQFAFCVTLYEGLYGRRPFEGTTYPELMENVKAGRVVAVPKRVQVPAAIRSAILRGLAVDPASRFPSIDALLAVLERDIGKRRRRAAVVLGSMVTIAAVALVARHQTSPGVPPCRTATERLAGVWDDRLKASTLRAFEVASGPAGRAAFGRVAAELDRYSARWVAGHTDACEATAVHHEQSDHVLDLRMQCLERRRTELAALTALLVTSDRELVANASQAVYALVAVDSCADREELAAAYPAPGPDQTSRVTELRDRLAEATAQQLTGKYTESLARATPILEQARQLDYPPLLAEALRLESGLHRLLGNGKAAETGLLELTRVGARARDDRMVGVAWADLVYVVGYLAGRPTDGLAFTYPARSMFDRVGGGAPEIRTALENYVGTILAIQGKYVEAAAAHERAIAIGENGLGSDHVDVAASLSSLGSDRYLQGRYQDAIRYYDRAIEIWVTKLGPEHPLVTRTLRNKALTLGVLGQDQEALVLDLRILEIEERILGPDAPQLASTLQSTAALYVGLEQFEAAVKLSERAIRIGGDAPMIALTRSGLGEALVGAGRCSDAVPHLQDAMKGLETSGAYKPVVADILRSLSECARRDGHLIEARAQIDRALAIGESIGLDSVGLADELVSRGQLALLDKRPSDARKDFERALAIVEKWIAANKAALIDPLDGLGAALLALGKSGEAIPHLERALAIEAAKGLPQRLANTRFVLARALWDSDRTRSHELATTARRGLAPHRRDRELAEIDAWLATHTLP